MRTSELHPHFVVVVPLTLRKMQRSWAFELNLIKGDNVKKPDILNKYDKT